MKLRDEWNKTVLHTQHYKDWLAQSKLKYSTATEELFLIFFEHLQQNFKFRLPSKALHWPTWPVLLHSVVTFSVLYLKLFINMKHPSAHWFPLLLTRQAFCCAVVVSLYRLLQTYQIWDFFPLCPGGSSQRGHVHHHPRAPPLSVDSTAAGAAGLWHARGLCWDAKEAGALPWHHREPPAYWLVLAEPGGVHQWGASAFPSFCLWPVQVAFQPSWYYSEVPNHQGW